MRSFKVLHVVGSSEFGGIAPYIVSLIKMVRGHGGDGKVLVTAPRVVDYFYQRGIEVVPIQGLDRSVNPVRDAIGLMRLVSHLRQNDYALVHTHTSKGGVIGRLAARLANVPVIIHSTQGYAFKDYAQNVWGRWFFLQLEKMATSWCDIIISANQADRQMVIEAGIVSEAKITNIPNGIDLKSIDAAECPSDLRKSLGLVGDGKIVGVMARLVPQKGIEYFLDAIPQITQVHPTVQFVVVGDGPQRVELEARVDRLGLKPVVNFVGFRSDWIQVLRVMDLFVMPSLWEGLPITLLGAMATSRAVVATRIKGITDVCGGAPVAWLVEPKDSQALAQAILALLADDALARAFGLAARQLVEEKYSEEVMNEQIWQVYEYFLVKSQ